MKLNSKYFDGIRVKPDQDRLLREQCPSCDWRGCLQPGRFPAPKGRGRDGQYFNFCIDHVRQYNKTYNYFDGMSDDDIASYQKNTVTGHRPTWSMGLNRSKDGSAQPADANPSGFGWRFETQDAFGFFPDSDDDNQPGQASRRPVRNAERKCLDALDLTAMATGEEIKARFKTLVKRLHPDSNNGIAGSEDKLREVIQAYNYLKRAGLC